MKEGFTFVDLETTGLEPATCRVIEIAAVRFGSDGRELDRFETLVDPGVEVPDPIRELTGIDTSTIRALGVPSDQALLKLQGFVCDDILVAFNADFDRGFLESEFRRSNLPFPSNPWRCALEEARRAWPVFRKHSLQALSTFFRLTRQEHRALTDCLIGAEVYRRAHATVSNGRIVDHFILDEICITSVDAENLYACEDGDELDLWTVPDFPRIHAYAPNTERGAGLVAVMEKARNAWLTERLERGPVPVLRLQRKDDGPYTLFLIKDPLEQESGDG